MKSTVDVLQERVAAVVELIGSLRAQVERLEHELAAAERGSAAAPPATGAAHGNRLLEELERLRAERATVRERVRELIREIDRVPW